MGRIIILNETENDMPKRRWKVSVGTNSAGKEKAGTKGVIGNEKRAGENAAKDENNKPKGCCQIR